MREWFAQGAFVTGLESGLREVNDILTEHLPRTGSGSDELPNDVVLR